MVFESAHYKRQEDDEELVGPAGRSEPVTSPAAEVKRAKVSTFNRCFAQSLKWALFYKC